MATLSLGTLALDHHGVALSVEHPLVQADDIRLGEAQVEVLEDLGEVEARREKKFSPYPLINPAIHDASFLTSKHS